jgi:hypothetical protein
MSISFRTFDAANDLTVFKKSPDPLRNLFERPLIDRPGERFVYNTACIIALETLIQNITQAHFLLPMSSTTSIKRISKFLLSAGHVTLVKLCGE